MTRQPGRYPAWGAARAPPRRPILRRTQDATSSPCLCTVVHGRRLPAGGASGSGNVGRTTLYRHLGAGTWACPTRRSRPSRTEHAAAQAGVTHNEREASCRNLAGHPACLLARVSNRWSHRRQAKAWEIPHVLWFASDFDAEIGFGRYPRVGCSSACLRGAGCSGPGAWPAGQGAQLGAAGRPGGDRSVDRGGQGAGDRAGGDPGKSGWG